MATRLLIPTDLTVGPVHWFDMMDDRTLTRPAGAAATGTVTSKGSAGKAITQATGSRHPAYSATAFNGKPGLTSDGSSDVLFASGVTRDEIAGSGGDACTVFFVKKYTSGTVWCKWESAVTNRFGLESGARWDFGNASAGGQFTSFTDGTSETINCYYIDGGATQRMRKNGTLDSNTNALSAALTSTSQSLAFFANSNNTNFSVAVISEVVWFNYQLTTTEIEQVEGYLAHKWGKTADLPSGHPYKSAAPTVTIADWDGPYIVNQGQTGSYGSGATGGTISMPFTPTSGNWLFAFLANDKGASALAISGWTQVDVSLSGTAITGAVFKKLSNGTETTITTSITSPGGSGYVVTVVEVANADDVDVYAKSNTNNATATRASGTATTGSTTQANDLALAFWATDSYVSVDAGAAETFSNSFERLAGTYSRGYYTIDPSAGGCPAISMGQKQIASSGVAVATEYTYTGDATDENILFLVVVKAPSGPRIADASPNLPALTVTAEAGFPKASTFTESFDGPYPDWDIWAEYDTADFVRYSGGKLLIDNDTSYPSLTSLFQFDMRDDGFIIKLEAPTSTGGTPSSGREIGFFVKDTNNESGNQFGIILDNANLVAFHGISGSFSYPASTGWNVSTKGWLRIREASGTIYVDYSADRSSWTTLHSRAAFSWMKACKIGIYAGHWNGGESGGALTTQWDNLNLDPGSAVTGDASITLGSLTVTADATLPVTASASPTLGSVTTTADATLPVTASASPTLGSVTTTADATLPVTADSSSTLGALTTSADATLPVTADASITLGAVTLTADGSVNFTGITGDANITLGAVTSTADATLPVTADASPSLGALTTTAAATLPVTADSSVSLGSLTTTASATVPATVDSSVTLGALTTTADAGVLVTATGLTDLPALTLSADAGAPQAVIDGNVTLGAVTLSGAGTIEVRATVDVALGAVTLTGTGVVEVGASGLTDLGSLTTTASGTLPVTGSGLTDLGALTTTASGTLPVTGSASLGLGPLTINSDALVGIKADAGITLGAVTLQSEVVLDLLDSVWNPAEAMEGPQRPATMVVTRKEAMVKTGTVMMVVSRG